MFYVGYEFDTKKCKQYRTIKGAKNKQEEDAALKIWNEDGTEYAEPEPEADVAPEASTEPEVSADPEASTEPEVSADPVVSTEPEQKIKELDEIVQVRVACDGVLNLRKSPCMQENNICGKAVRGQTYAVKSIHDLGDEKWLETIGGIFILGDKNYVEII